LIEERANLIDATPNFKRMEQHRGVQRRAAQASTKAESVIIVQESKKYVYDNSEAARINNRKSHEKSAVKAMNFVYPKHPWATLLLQARIPFKALIKRIPLYNYGQYRETKTFREILTQDLSTICVLDSSRHGRRLTLQVNQETEGMLVFPFLIC
jgi:hypothetical protein